MSAELALKERRSEFMRPYTQWRWHLDEVFVKINVVQHDLRRAMSGFRRMSNLQNFAADHAPVDKHFSHQRNIERRIRFKTLHNAPPSPSGYFRL